MKYSINYGINVYDPKFIHNNDLGGCVNDAKSMSMITTSCGYMSTIVVNANANYAEFTSRLTDLAKKCVKGDWVFLSFSGHGTYYDINENTRMTGICLYDRVLWDNEFKSLLSKFAEGVSIIWVCDSCYAQDNFKAALNSTNTAKIKFFDFFKAKSKVLPKTEIITDKAIKCNVVAFGSSTINEPSYDLGDAGLFSKKFGELFKKQRGFNLYKFYVEVAKLVKESQYPQNPVFSVVNGVESRITFNICF